MTEFPDVLTVPELANALRIGRNSAYALVASGAIRSVSIGRSIRIPMAAFAEFLGNGSDPTVTDEAANTTTPDLQEGNGRGPG